MAEKMKKNSKYSHEILQKALAEVKSGSRSAYGASKYFGIPGTTIRQRLSGDRGAQPTKLKTLNDVEENLLVYWIIKCAAAGSPKTRIEIMSAAGQLARLDERKTPNENFPSSGWFQKFEQRHRDEISRRTPQSLGKASGEITIEKLQFAFDQIWNQFVEENCLDLMSKPAQ